MTHKLRTAHPPVLVIGGGSANGLGIARNLGSQGIPVYCVTSNPQEWLLRSKYCRGAAVIPGIEDDPALLRRVLLHLHTQWAQPGVLFPTTDTALLTVATLYPDWAGHRTFLPPPAVLATCVLKHRFYPSLLQHDVPHPRTWYPEDRAIASIIEHLTFPVYIRPSHSLRFVQQFRYKGFLATSGDEVQRYLALCARQGYPVMIQEVIPGSTREGYAIRGFIDRHFRLTALLATQKVRQPSTFTNSNIKVSVPLSHVQTAVSHLLRYLQAIQYHGLFMAEFKRDPRDGQLKLLEINARSAGGNAIATACGMNDILMAYRDALGADIQPTTTYEYGRYHIDLTRDIRVLLYRLRQLQLSWRDLQPYLHKKSWQFFALSDPHPFLHFLATMLRSPERVKVLSLPPG